MHSEQVQRELEQFAENYGSVWCPQPAVVAPTYCNSPQCQGTTLSVDRDDDEPTHCPMCGETKGLFELASEDMQDYRTNVGGG